MIDPKRVAHESASDFITTYKSKAFGYDIDLTGLGWAKADPAACGFQLWRSTAAAETGAE